jgi:mono/diheme cytochrome c family protein
MRRRAMFVLGISLAVVLLVVALVAAACGGTTTTTAAPTTTAGVTTSAGGTIDAAALYTQNCVGCHKDIPGGSADAVKAVIESGKESMPGFTDKLSAEQITALVDYTVAGGK